MTKVTGNRGSDTSSITAMIEGVRSLKDLSGNGSTLSSVREVLEIAEHLKSFGAESNGDGGGWMSYLKPVLPELARSLPVLMSQFGRAGTPAAGTSVMPAAMATGLSMPPNGTLAGEQQSATPAAAPAASTPAPGTSPAATPDAAAAPAAAPAGVTDEQFMAVKKQLIAYAWNMARLGRPPAVYADLAIEMVDVQGDAVSASFVQEIVKAPDFKTWFDDLQKIGEPALVTQQAWFEAPFIRHHCPFTCDKPPCGQCVAALDRFMRMPAEIKEPLMKKASAPSAPTWDDLTPLEKLFGAGLVVIALAEIGREYRRIEHKKMVDERMRLVKVLLEEMKAEMKAKAELESQVHSAGSFQVI